MSVVFLSLASGSSGNCYYLGYNGNALLIDAGIGIRTIRKRLKEHELTLDDVRGVFITHDHIDHIKSAGNLGEQQHIPVYTTAAIHGGINRNHCIGDKLSGCVRVVEKDIPLRFLDFRITAFEVPHDGSDNVGYFVEVGDCAFAFATDIGHITPTAAAYLRRADHLILEANYDAAMLADGPYPLVLQHRIASDTGHLSNDAMATFLAEQRQPHWRHVWLCHLSRENNTPDRALQSVSERMPEMPEIPFSLTVLQRTATTGPFIIGSFA
jgi:phosphoribosyl 1,2-cyclic phosphodiesterase